MKTRALLRDAQPATEPNDSPPHLTDEADAAIKTLHAAIVRVRDTGDTPRKTVLDRLQAFSRGTSRTHTRGPRERTMVEAIYYAARPGIAKDGVTKIKPAPLTDPGRRRRTGGKKTAFEVAAEALKEQGITETPARLRHLWETDWARKRVEMLDAAWRRKSPSEE